MLITFTKNDKLPVGNETREFRRYHSYELPASVARVAVQRGVAYESPAGKITLSDLIGQCDRLRRVAVRRTIMELEF